MHISALICQKNPKNLFVFIGKAVYTSSIAYMLWSWSRIFTKLLKIPISILRRLNIRVIIYVDDLLMLGFSKEELIQARDIIIFLLQHLGFVINQKKCALQPVQKINFLGLIVNSKSMTLALTAEKIAKVKSLCQDLLFKHRITVLELT